MSAKNTKTEIKRMARVVLGVCGFVLLTTLTACSSGSTSWQHPTKPKDTWSKDIAACKARANTLIARVLAVPGNPSSTTPDGRTTFSRTCRIGLGTAVSKLAGRNFTRPMRSSAIREVGFTAMLYSTAARWRNISCINCLSLL